jgi:hypothetical protein
MANYLLIYHGGSMGATPEEQEQKLAQWGEWMKQCGESLVDAGNPCADASSVTSAGSEPYSGNERVTGYSVISAPDMEAAQMAALMVPLVVDGSGSVDVYETFNAM